MKVFFLLVALLTIDPSKISKINSLKSEAKKAYIIGDFKKAIEKYKYLRDSLGVKEEEVDMNLANSYFQLNDTTNALNTYAPLTQSSNSKIKSWANQQSGVVTNRQGKYEEALNYFKQALKAEPNNDQARYNYEMVKKKLEEKKKQDQKQNQDKNNQDKKDDQNKDQQNKEKKDRQNKDQEKKDQKDKQDKDKKDEQKKDQQNKDQQNKDKKDQQQKDQEQKDKEKKEKEQQEKKQQKDKDKKDDKKDDQNTPMSDKMKDMKISEEKAKMILEAMKNQEVQYLQQNKRKASKPKDKGKPDW
jgi:tetratricopeptide (TPR) repeat protein